MTYQVLARKWRPQDFSSLVGQEHIVTALRNGLREGRIAQAYLFSGIRGVGKTTAARVLAKALNCERGPGMDPCNECPTCLEITSGQSLDVLEVDAATYSKVEQVRELTEALRYGPASARYKVVVLDEVHRLSRQAFDALLKIVEEPPAHLVFIFATTEIDAVPATILSRCQEFQFRRVPSPVLAAHLRTICQAEDIQASDAALRMLARAGEGSVRDSVALLDQMSTFGSGEIRDEDAQQLLGGFDTAVFQGLLQAILEGQSLEIFKTVREIEASGWDPPNVYGQFLLFVRDALHLAMGGDPSSLDLPAEEAATLGDRVKPHGYEGLLQILQLLIDSETTVRRTELSLLALEIAWLRAAELPKVARIQDLLAGADPSGHSEPSTGSTGGSRTSEGPAPGVRAASRGRHSPDEKPQDSLGARRSPEDAEDGRLIPPLPENVRREETEPVLESPATGDPPAPREEQPEASIAPAPATETAAPPSEPAKGLTDSHSLGARDGEAGNDDLENLGTCDPARLADVMDLLGARRQSLAAHLSTAEIRVDRRTLRITPPGGDTLLESALCRAANARALGEALETVWGPGVEWKIESSRSRESQNEEKRTSPRTGTRTSPAPRSKAPRPKNSSSESSRARAPRKRDQETGALNGSPEAEEPTRQNGPVGHFGEEPPAWAHERASYNAAAPPDWHSPNPPAAIPEDQLREASSQPVVQSLLEIFGGSIQRIDSAAENPQ
ncbi:MAG: DNA polymerase III subunit gamma/tau [Acidobacteriota bacterium]